MHAPLKANTPVDTALLLLTSCGHLASAFHVQNQCLDEPDMKYNATISAVLMAIERHLEAVLKRL